MGMAASQARLLTITARMHDVEYQAQSIQNAKIALATQKDQIYQNYLDALDSTTFTIKDNSNNTVVANFNTLCGIDAARFKKGERYVLRDDHDRIIVSDEIYDAYNKFVASGSNDAYAFALYMMNGQPEPFDYNTYTNKINDIYTEKNNSKEGLSTALKDKSDSLIEKLYQLLNLNNSSSTLTLSDLRTPILADTEKQTKENIRKELNYIYDNLINNYSDYSDNEEAEKLKSEIKTAYETFEYQMFSQFGEDIYSAEGDKEDFDHDDFWYYVNMFKQIQANGGAIVKISDYNGIDGIGNAATDSDWLQEMVKSGKITIDVSTLDNKGNLSFKSTSVPSDSALEYTTTSTIDKSKLAKAEAEYEHKTKEVDQKDKKFDLDLNKLETERSALKTEYDSVKKVVEDNVERTFGIFS